MPMTGTAGRKETRDAGERYPDAGRAVSMNTASAFMPESQSDATIDRQRLLDSAKRLMAAYGYERTPIEVVASDAGTDRKSVV